MAASLTLDAGAAHRLAALDPALGHLPAALPRERGGADWLLHDAVWTPGSGCRLAYQLPAGEGPPTFVAVSLTAGGWAQHDYREDDRLPGLALAADPGTVVPRIEAMTNEAVQRCRIEPVKYRPGRRAVLRYEVQTPGRSLVYYAKVFRPEDFATVARLVTALAGESTGDGLVPALAATWDDAHTIVAAGHPGRSLSSLLGSADVPVAQRTLLAGRLGHLLARFHAQGGVAAPRWTPGDQLARLDEALKAAECAEVALTPRLRQLRDELAANMPPKGAEVLAHGGFRAGQVLLDTEGRLVLLDVDGLCRSAPGRDLGSALAHLRWQAIRQPGNRAVLDAASHAVLDAYEAQAGPVDRRTLDWWHAAGLVQVAARRFRRLETDDWTRVPTLVDEAMELLEGDRSTAGPKPLILPDLMDCGTIEKILIGALAPDDVNGAFRVVSAHRLPSATGRRSVVRYVVTGLKGGDVSVLVGKAFAERRRAALLHESLRLLSTAALAAPRAGGGRALSLPEPLAHVPDMGLVVYRHHDGVPLSEIKDPSARLDGMRRAGRWLAGLHSCAVSLPRSLSLEGEVASTGAWATVIGRAYPDLGPRAQSLADHWSAALPAPPSGPTVPLHKDFHPGHVLIGPELHVVDFDESRQGDRSFDLAHFSVYAQLMEGGESPGALVAAFLSEYDATAGRVPRGSLNAFQAYTWLKVARQWTVSAAPFRTGSPARRRAGVEHALDRGERCLSG